MAIDTPAKIAVLGSGPVGLEAALYARYLGYDVAVYERGRVAENVRRTGHVRSFSPWKMNYTPLAMAALSAQDESWRPPPAEAFPTAREFVEHYLLPLSATDLLAESIHEQVEVVAVGRETLLKTDQVGDEARGDEDFCILLRDPNGKEWFDTADVVIDASGTFGRPNALGRGGIPAVGETRLREKIEYGLPDFSGSARDAYAGRKVLVLGSGHSAATNIVALAALDPAPKITWITRREPSAEGPIVRIPDDPLAARDALAQAANALVRDDGVRHWPGTFVEAIDWKESKERFEVTLVGEHARTLDVDRIIANVGYQPDDALHRELQVRVCHVTGALQLISGSEAETPRILSSEPNFYILGAKSYGRNSRFLLTDGHRQIRDLFAVIGDRAALDLYASIAKLPS